MSHTTKARVLLTAPELSVITNDDVWDIALEDVQLFVSYSVYGIKQELAERHLVAHFLTLNSLSGSASSSGSASGGIESEQVGRVKVEYSSGGDMGFAADRWDTTQYGVMFNNIRKSRVVRFTIGVIDGQ